MQEAPTRWWTFFLIVLILASAALWLNYVFSPVGKAAGEVELRISAACEDNRDNDNDGSTDFPGDCGCSGANDDTEDTECSAALCGNGIQEAGEQCDDNTELSCQALGFAGGTQTCINCVLDSSDCSTCGDGRCASEEQCDTDCQTGCSDLDGDGFGNGLSCGVPTDCNDQDVNTNPSAVEICDQLDNNCNGETDEGCGSGGSGGGGGQGGGGGGGSGGGGGGKSGGIGGGSNKQTGGGIADPAPSQTEQSSPKTSPNRKSEDLDGREPSLEFPEGNWLTFGSGKIFAGIALLFGFYLLYLYADFWRTEVIDHDMLLELIQNGKLQDYRKCYVDSTDFEGFHWQFKNLRLKYAELTPKDRELFERLRQEGLPDRLSAAIIMAKKLPRPSLATSRILPRKVQEELHKIRFTDPIARTLRKKLAGDAEFGKVVAQFQEQLTRGRDYPDIAAALQHAGTNTLLIRAAYDQQISRLKNRIPKFW